MNKTSTRTRILIAGAAIALIGFAGLYYIKSHKQRKVSLEQLREIVRDICLQNSNYLCEKLAMIKIELKDQFQNLATKERKMKEMIREFDQYEIENISFTAKGFNITKEEM